MSFDALPDEVLSLIVQHGISVCGWDRRTAKYRLGEQASAASVQTHPPQTLTRPIPPPAAFAAHAAPAAPQSGPHVKPRYNDD